MERFSNLAIGFTPYLVKPAEDVIRWTVGEPGFDTPQPVVDAAIEALEAGQTKYTWPRIDGVVYSDFRTTESNVGVSNPHLRRLW